MSLSFAENQPIITLFVTFAQVPRVGQHVANIPVEAFDIVSICYGIMRIPLDLVERRLSQDSQL